MTTSLIITSHWPSPTSWSERWREALTTRLGVTNTALISGSAYAKHDRQLDVTVESGAAHAVAGADRRLPHQVEVAVPAIPEALWTTLIDCLADRADFVNALLERELPVTMLDVADQLGVPLLPVDGELAWSCSCAHDVIGRRRPQARTAAARRAADRIADLAAANQSAVEPSTTGGNGETANAPIMAKQPCKHAAAVLLIIGQQLDDDPFELFVLRGRTRTQIKDALSERRDDIVRPADGPSVRADEAWSRSPGTLPSPTEPPAGPGSLNAFASDPPPSAPFTADGLRVLADAAATRAWRVLEGSAEAHLHLDLPTDLARLAAELERTPQWRGLVARSGLTGAELSARANAWRIAGAGGVAVQLAHRRLARVAPNAQLRQAPDGSWFRYEKRGGRWMLVTGPAEHPESLLATDPIGGS
ncbi:MAG: hypothetical protein O3C27_12650 [Actinomycetota bacterium]|nr:hypothetical protein [Actinomycetota bacterium]